MKEQPGNNRETCIEFIAVLSGCLFLLNHYSLKFSQL